MNNENPENISLLSKDLDSSSHMPLKYRVFNYYYQILRKKSISFLLLTFFMVLETLELISYVFIDQYQPLWKTNEKSMHYIQVIFGVTRITPLMQYLKFDYYFILFCILLGFIFLDFLMVAMTLSFNRTESKFYAFSVSFTSYVTSNVCVFFLVPVSEVMLLMLKCNKENKVDIVKDSVECFQSLHYLYIVLAVVVMILYLCLIILNAVFNFNPFSSNKSTAVINPAADTFLVIFKIVLVILYVLITNDWISIIIMVLGSLLNLKNAWENPTYNSYFLQCMVSMRNGSVFWTYLILFICKIVERTKFNGMIYLLVVGYPFIFIASVFYYRYLRNEFCEGKSNFKNVNEFLMRVNYLKVLIDAFIYKNMSNKGGNNFNNLKKKEILLRGQIAIHEESCTNEECPLKKFLENQGNFQVQKTSLLHYMNILFNEAIKKFPDSQLILMNFVHFNFDKKYNLNAAKLYLSKLERFKNSLTEDYIIFFIKKSATLIGNKYGEEGAVVKLEDTPQHKFKRFKLLIDAATKLYGEFWGNLVTNLTNNLNLNKLFFLGNKLNEYLHELNILWDEFKTKKLELDQQTIAQLYCLFLRDIIQNKSKAEEIAKKLNEDQGYEVHKTEEDKVDVNNLDTILENQDYIMYCRCNDMGHCNIIQCSNSIISLLGYQKQELMGKKIEMLMPMLCQSEHSKMLGSRLKNMRMLMNTNNYKEPIKAKEKKQVFILLKNKVGYLNAVTARFGIYNDDDFSNTFIIKARFELKDPKVVYAYYIFTKSDFTIDSISSSSINLGLTMDLLKKHLINLNHLIRSQENESINIIEHIPELEEETQTLTWVFPDIIYPKTDVGNNHADLDMEKLVSESKTKHIILSVSSFKFYEEHFGYCFKFTECENSNCGNSGNGLRNEAGFDMNGFSEFSQKLMLYDISKLNYVRADIVKEKAVKENEGNNTLANVNNNNILTVGGLTKTSANDLGGLTFTSQAVAEENKQNENEDGSDSDKEKDNILTYDKIHEYRMKSSEEIKAFIFSLSFYGKEIFLKKKLPNKEENNVGYTIEPNINITLDDFVKRIERSKVLDKRQLNTISQTPSDSLSSITGESGIDMSYVSSSTVSLNNLFSKKSITYIKVFTLSYFILVLCMLLLEFIIDFNKFKNLKERMFYSSLSYEMLSHFMYTKFFITEAVITQEDLENQKYPLYNNPDRNEYVISMLDELSEYRLKITDVISLFNNATVSFGKEYTEFVDNCSVNINTLTNKKPTQEYQPFWTGINRIPTSIFYVSTVTENRESIAMEDRNTYELMYNLLNDYYTLWKRITLLLSQEVKDNSKMHFILTIVFAFSFVLFVVSSGSAYYTLNKFLGDGTRPVDLIMTIKKTKFEELKVICEGFLNKLLNNFIGNEEIDDENPNDTGNFLASDDIVITKFKQRNKYNQSLNSNKGNLFIFLSMIFFFILMEIYFVFKYVYTRNNLKHIKNFVEVHNITLYSESDLILSYNIAKSYFYNSSIPILNSKETSFQFQKVLLNLSNSFEEVIQTTYSKMKFLNTEYINTFYQGLNQDITNLNTGGFSSNSFYGTMLYGFKPLILRYLELIRYNGIIHFESAKDNKEFLYEIDYAEAAVLLKDVIRPWYSKIKTELENYFDVYYGNVKLVITSLFIVASVVLLIVYLLVWKTVEDRLEMYLKSSIDLINLIPEEIKCQMIIKLNEEEQKEKKE